MPHVRGHHRRSGWFGSHWVRSHYRRSPGANAMLVVGVVVLTLFVIWALSQAS